MTRQAAYSAAVSSADGSFSMTPSGLGTTATAQFATARIERGGAALDFGIAGAVADGQGGLGVGRGPVLERIQALAQGLELSWTFPAPPQGSGDVLVRVGVGGLQPAKATRSATVLKDPASGALLRVGQALWVDATGKTTALDQELSGGVLTFRVPEALLAASSFPAVLDPVVSPDSIGPVQFAEGVAAGTIQPLAVARFGPGSITSDDLPAPAIDCRPDGGTCAASYTSDSVVTLTATPEPGAWFVGWSGLCQGTNVCTIRMSQARFVYAYFEPGTWPVRVVKVGGGRGAVSGEGIDCPAGTAICTVQVPNNRPARYQARLGATPDGSSMFFGWSADCGGSGVCTLSMDRPRTAYATFAPAGFPLTVATAGPGTGTVTGGGLSCGDGNTACFATFPNATPAAQVTLTARPVGSSVFGGWSGACSGTATTCTVTMDAARRVSATFLGDQQPLAVTVTGAGRVTATTAGGNLDCTTASATGCLVAVPRQVPASQVTLTATALAGALFAGWSGPCVATGNQCTVTMDRAVTVAAFFQPSQLPLTVVTAGSGGGTVTGPGIACATGSKPGCSTMVGVTRPATLVTLHATPNGSSLFAGWSGPCGGTGDCVVSMDQARTAIATFAPLNLAVRVVVSGSGTVTGPPGFSCSASAGCSFTVPNTTPATQVVLTASSGTFVGWGGNCPGTAATCTLSVDDNKSVYATFQGTAPPPPVTYAVGGTVSGLAGPGLVLRSGGDTLSPSAPGPFSFQTKLASGSAYSVAVSQQPAGQTCAVTGGSGTVGTSDVTSVLVTCTTQTFSVGGTVAGLVGSGLVLATAGEANLPVAPGASGFTFAAPLPYGASYGVTVATQPALQTCSVAYGSGTVSGAVTGIAVTCACSTGYTLSGGACVLQNQTRACSPANAPALSGTQGSADGGVTWGACVATACNVGYTLSSGTCLPAQYSVGGVVNGLAASGLVLANNGGDVLQVDASGTFTFPTRLTYGATYDVTVAQQPAGETCTVSGGSGTLGATDVLTVAVDCTVNRYAVSVTVSGLAGSGLRLANSFDGAAPEDLAILANGLHAFGVTGTTGQQYAVAVTAQPSSPTQVCTVANGSGTLSGSVSDVVVTCATQSYTIGGTVTGLVASGLKLSTAGEPELSVAAGAGAFTFDWALPSGTPYSVFVSGQPTSQTCTVASGSGTLASSNVTGVAVSCGCAADHVLVGGACVLANQSRTCDPANAPAGTGSQSSTDGGQSWTACLAQGGCNLGFTNAGGVCTADRYPVSANVTGLSGSGLVLQDNGGDDLSVAAPGGLVTFATGLTYGSSYAVTVASQPANPWQTCTVSGGGPAQLWGPISNVQVTCSTNTYRIGGTVSGLTGPGLVLRTSGEPDLSVNAPATSFTFANALPSGTAYAVSVGTQPTGHVCSVASGSGALTSADVTSVAVSCTCATPAYVLANGVCALANQSRSCTPANAPANSGTESSTDGGLTWGSCVATVCNAGYTPSGGACVPTPYTVGGTVTGALGTGLTLALNGGQPLVVSGTSFTFSSTPLTAGAPYAVTVVQPPSPPAQHCTVANGTGTMPAANVTSVAVTCRSEWSVVDGGLSFAAGLRPDGTLWGWGANGSGQVGDGTTAQKTSPTAVVNGTGFSALAVGDGHAVAIKTAGGTLQAWGANANGQLGDNTTTSYRTTPVTVVGASGYVAVSGGSSHSVGIRTDANTTGALMAWGGNAQNQLGDGTTTVRRTPVAVRDSTNAAATGFTAVAAGSQHNIALRSDGTVWTWGYNTNGQLGDGTRTNRATARQVPAATGFTNSGFTAVAAGFGFTVAVKGDGTVWAWGQGSSGQLGNNTTTARQTTPVQVLNQGGTAFTGAVGIAAGNSHAVVVKADGTVWAWGSNASGQLGDGTATQRNTPVQVTGLTGVAIANVSAGDSFTIVTGTDGRIYAFGQNANGQLGLGTTSTSPTSTPAPVP